MALTVRVTSLDPSQELILAKCRSSPMTFGLFDSAELQSIGHDYKNPRDRAGTAVFYRVEPLFDKPDFSNLLGFTAMTNCRRS